MYVVLAGSYTFTSPWLLLPAEVMNDLSSVVSKPLAGLPFHVIAEHLDCRWILPVLESPDCGLANFNAGMLQAVVRDSKTPITDSYEA